MAEGKIMTVFEEIRKQIIDVLPVGLGVRPEDLVVPPDPKMGDLSLPCFELAKKMGKNPVEAAKELESGIRKQESGIIERISSAGPYLNFILKSSVVASLVFRVLTKQKNKFGESKIGRGERVMIEYSSPNTHKEFHVGHLRNICLGSALVNLYRASGYKTTPVNYINDFGLHVAKCLWGLEKFHRGEKPPAEKGRWLGQVYAEAAQAAENDESAKKEIAGILAKLENKDKETMKLWKKTRQWSLDGFEKIYREFGVKFSECFYEHKVKDKGKAVVQELLKKAVAQKGEGGAVIVDLKKYGLDVFLILKSDGTGLYATSDLALAFEKFRKFKIDSSLYVVDVRQSLYLKQVFKTLELYGFKKPMRHISYDFVRLPEGIIASRAGRVILYEDLRDQIVAFAREETKKRHPDWPEKKIRAVALALSLGAMKFGMLRTNPRQVITFNIKEALSFDGQTGPYLQYSLARINSILRKNKEQGARNKEQKSRFFIVLCSLLITEIEKRLLLKIAAFPEIVSQSTAAADPSHLAKYLYELAKHFSDFYESCSVLRAENEELKLARLELIKAVKFVLEKGLEILGIPAMEEM